MITYEPFWETLNDSVETTYTLIKDHSISSSTLDRLRKNKAVSTNTVDDLCRILDCPVESVIKYMSSDEEKADSDR